MMARWLWRLFFRFCVGGDEEYADANYHDRDESEELVGENPSALLFKIHIISW